MDALAARKQQLIDRLAEYRTALIARAVTKGLPHGVPQAEEFDLSPRSQLRRVEPLNNPDFQEIVFAGLARGIYETVTAQ